MSDSGLQDAALLLLALGEEEAANVLKHLAPGEVQKLGKSMSELTNISNEQLSAVLTSFGTEIGKQSSIGLGADDYLRSVMTKALGEEKASMLLDRILQDSDTSGLDHLKWLDAASVAQLIKYEHPQIIATILVHLEKEQASLVLATFDARARGDILKRIASIDGVQPLALRELNDSLGKILSGGDKFSSKPLGGIRAAAEILNFLPGSIESETMEKLRESDAELAEKLVDEMFKFEDVMDLDNRAIQAVLREINGDDLILALKGADKDLREKILGNMSQRAAEQLREDLESKGPVKLADVEKQQREFLKIVRRLAEEGQISMGGKSEQMV
ncbi:MAG: flagellar motor switch protein FliG [Burkholderiales bacterium]